MSAAEETYFMAARARYTSGRENCNHDPGTRGGIEPHKVSVD